MFCSHCGSALPPDASQCPACGTPVTAAPAPDPVVTAQTEIPQAAPQEPVKDYQTVNIILLVASVLCCGSLPSLVTAIIGVVFSSQAKSLLLRGESDAARDKAHVAKIMMIVTAILLAIGIVVGILCIALYGGVALAMLQSNS